MSATEKEILVYKRRLMPVLVDPTSFPLPYRFLPAGSQLCPTGTDSRPTPIYWRLSFVAFCTGATVKQENIDCLNQKNQINQYEGITCLNQSIFKHILGGSRAFHVHSDQIREGSMSREKVPWRLQTLLQMVSEGKRGTSVESVWVPGEVTRVMKNR